ncbi:putative baseplate assembly protein [Desulfogranum marinum]|uniref:putative baseplate assembly protein n=1 Tax=Desulfogranum marinum TaxID=453220 RepID=UPI0029C86742|nr:putative baseplate assembly protein [Desulfogranum marinum]
MPLNRPILDDRSYVQLRDELIRRIPVYAPEWTDHNPSDPGITLIELFSFLGENLLYRFNQIPDATYMEFLRLLQIPLRPATASRTLAVITTKEANGVRVPRGTEAKAGSVLFETLTEVRALPVTCLAVSKREVDPPLAESEEGIFFKQSYESVGLASEDATAPYKSELVPTESPGIPVDFDKAVDSMLWLAVLAENVEAVETVKKHLAEHKDAPLLLNIGFVPEIRLDADEEIPSPKFTERFRCPGEETTIDFPAVQWSISTGVFEGDGTPLYRSLTIEHDTTEGLSREGVIRLRLPRDLVNMGDFPVDDPDMVGTGDLPPRLDDEETERRVIFWLRAFHLEGNGFGKVLYVGTNATQVVQTRQAKAEFLGTGNGQPNQEYALIHKNGVSGSLDLEVEESKGWQSWKETYSFHASRESDRQYVLDAEAGKVKFGNGLQGYTPQIGQRIRVLSYRYGGGLKGNVAPGAISKLNGISSVKVTNPLVAYGGADAESLEKALDRIPGELRRRDRAVTSDDFRELAEMAPGANIGRAECLPLYHPHLPKTDSSGVVSVIVWPTEDNDNPDAPMPNKNQLRSVCQWLDARRLVTTELYVLPPRYREIAVAVGLQVKAGYGIDAVRHWVELVIRQYLAPLPPYGPEGKGWPLGRRIHGPELEAAALQVEGVEYLVDLQVVGWDSNGIRLDNTVELRRDEVIELIGITVEVGPVTVDVGEALQPKPPKKPAVPVPVLKEEC